MTNRLKKLLINPVTAAIGAGSGVLAIMDPHTLWILASFVWGNVGSLFPAASTLGFFVIPEIDLGKWAWVGQGIQGLALLLAVVFVVKQLDSAYQKLQERL